MGYRRPRRPWGYRKLLTAPHSPWQSAYIERFIGPLALPTMT
jgi:hypothetical protein